MRRRDLEHIIRAAADIADDDEIIVIGSQSILGQHPDAPDELCVSAEADVYASMMTLSALVLAASPNVS
jgi:hypothetical protein